MNRRTIREVQPCASKVKVPSPLRAALARHLATHSTHALARALGVSIATIEDALTGGTLLPRTIARLEETVAAFDPSAARPEAP